MKTPLPAIFAVLLLLLIVFSSPVVASGATISEYRNISRPCRNSAGRPQLAIRSFKLSGAAYFLLVDPYTFETSIAPAATVVPDHRLEKSIRHTPFGSAVTRYTSPPFKLQNQGAIRAAATTGGMFLTVDMCPSRRPFEKAFFETVAGLSSKSPVPLAIAMTGNWLENHPEELGWLLQREAEGKLAITWINHSYSHPYDPKVPLERNFLLSAGIDFDREVLATEQLMLEKGLTPSPFFRFPGLVSDGRLMDRLRGLSLIPIGSNAWLAKGEKPKAGSFILVHGNGNEPQGISKVLPLLRETGTRLLPLAQAFATEGEPLKEAHAVSR